ncbi:MAG: hypothetical protein M0R40_00545 [Firmicutes bacterium]|nr:hypothetical protein [Bacillota bacterium]
MKYKCPTCGSKNIVFWKEEVRERLYRFKKDGNIHEKHFKSMIHEKNGLEGLLCLECKEFMNWIDSSAEEWGGKE